MEIDRKYTTSGLERLPAQRGKFGSMQRIARALKYVDIVGEESVE